MSKKLKKPRKNKKHAPVPKYTPVKDAWERSVWLSDSSIQTGMLLHDADKIRGYRNQPPRKVLHGWSKELNKTKYKWRFIYYAFNLITETVEIFVIEPIVPGTPEGVWNEIKDELKPFFDDLKPRTHSWGWVAVPSQDIIIDNVEQLYLDYFIAVGLTDAVKVARNNVAFLARLNAVQN